MKTTSTEPVTRLSPQKRFSSMVTLLFGIWLVIAGFVLSVTHEGMWNSVVIGVLLFACSGLRLRRNSSFLWSCVNVILGFWMLLGPRPLVFIDNPFRWTDFALGWATVVLSIAAATGHDRVVERERPTIERTTLPEYHGAV
jgi:hypothetical protein